LARSDEEFGDLLAEVVIVDCNIVLGNIVEEALVLVELHLLAFTRFFNITNDMLDFRLYIWESFSKIDEILILLVEFCKSSTSWSCFRLHP